MHQKTKNKLLLCLQEMLYIKEILDLRCADDQTARMLGLYVAMRMDDFIHLLPTLPDSNPNKEYIESGKQEYKDNLQDARNKLGAHFQTITQEDPDDEDHRLHDFIERNRIFSEIDYSKLTDLIEEALIVYQIATNTEGHEPALAHLSEIDREKIEAICKAENRNSRLSVYNDFLHIARPNSVGATVVDKGQQKAQQLNSIDMLISDVSKFYDADYADPALKRMFKRMLVCWIVNFYDNLITRPIPTSAPQHDPGLDQLLNDTFDDDRTRDTQHRIASLISEMQSLKDNQAVLDNARAVRNKACAHLDSALDSSDINAIIDSYDSEVLREQYGLWHSTFNRILESHPSLIPLRPMPKAEIYDAWTEEDGRKDFYGNALNQIPNATFTGSLSVEEAMSVLKDPSSENHRLAQEKIRRILFDAKGTEYEILCNRLCNLMASGITNQELAIYSLLLHEAGRGFPERNQELLIGLWNIIKRTNPGNHKFILWPLTANATYDQSGRLRGLIAELMGSTLLWTRIYGGLIAFHAEIKRKTSLFAYTQDPQLEGDFQEIANEIPRNRTVDLIFWLVIASHWKFDQFFIQPNWHAYSVEITERLKRSCETFCQTVNVGQEIEEYLLSLCDHYRYIELLWQLIGISKQTGDQTEDFISVVENNLMDGSDDKAEIAYWALCFEELGWLSQAKRRLERLVEQNNSDKEIRLSYVKFLTRHPEYSQELEKQRKYLEDHFDLTEDDRTWMV